MKFLKNTLIKNAVKIKTILKDNTSETAIFLKEKTLYFQEIIRNTILSVQLYKKYELFSNSDVTICIQTLSALYDKSEHIIALIDQNLCDNSNEFIENIISLLQTIIDKLSVILSGLVQIT